jgi:hypothetical protein
VHHHTEFASVELAKLFGRDVDATDLAGELEVPDLLGIVAIEHLAGEQCLQLALAFLFRRGLFARLALGGFALGPLDFRPDREGPGKIGLSRMP